ncbi:MAG: hypothetical protein V4503_10445 [Gemmatimonadota bacterium]
MRVAAIALVLAVPAPLLAQYPPPGQYEAGVTPAGDSRVLPFRVVVEKSGDSTTVRMGQADETAPLDLPIIDQRAFASGFEITLGVVDGGLRCRFAPPDTAGRWDALCEDPDGTALYGLYVVRKKGG